MLLTVAKRPSADKEQSLEQSKPLNLSEIMTSKHPVQYQEAQSSLCEPSSDVCIELEIPEAVVSREINQTMPNSSGKNPRINFLQKHGRCFRDEKRTR